MARGDGRLVIRIVGDAQSFNNSLSGVTGRLQGFGRDLRRIGGQLAAAGAAAAVAFAQEAISAASDLEQSFGAVETVFGDASGAIDRFAATADRQFGLSQRSANEMAARIGASLQAVGFEADQAADVTVQLEQRGADLAATFGGEVSDAVDAIGSLLRGERDPIERFGVAIKQADINARLAAQGLDDLEGQEHRTAEAQAALDLLFEQTANSAGAFGRESDTLAGQQQRLRAQFENLSAQMGEKLLPVATRLIEWAGENLPAAFETAERWIGAVVGAIQTAAEWAANLSLVVEDVVGTMIDYWQTFASVVDAVWDGIYQVAKTTVDLVIAVVNTMLAPIQFAIDQFNRLQTLIGGAGPKTFTKPTSGGIREFASGGIVTSPTLALIGEAGPEAVVPLDRASGMGVTNVTVNMPPGSDGDDVVRALRRWQRRNGPVPLSVTG